VPKSANPLICVAACAGAFGVKGEVKIKSFTADPKACLRYGPLKDKKGDVLLTVKSSRTVKNAIAVWCEEITTREQAEKLKSTKLYVYRADEKGEKIKAFFHPFSKVGVPTVDIKGERIIIFFEEADEDPNRSK